MSMPTFFGVDLFPPAMMFLGIVSLIGFLVYRHQRNFRRKKEGLNEREEFFQRQKDMKGEAAVFVKTYQLLPGTYTLIPETNVHRPFSEDRIDLFIGIQKTFLELVEKVKPSIIEEHDMGFDSLGTSCGRLCFQAEQGSHVFVHCQGRTRRLNLPSETPGMIDELKNYQSDLTAKQTSAKEPYVVVHRRRPHST